MSETKAEVNTKQPDKKPDVTDRLETARQEMGEVVDMLATNDRKVFVSTDTKKFLGI